MKSPPAWQQFESRVVRQCTGYLRDGRAKIHKVDPPTKVLGRGRIIFLANPFLDFIGVASGRMFMFEAKRTERPYLPLGGRGLAKKQINDLLAWRAADAITGILWEHDAVVRWISGYVMMTRIEENAKHLKPDDGIEIPQTPYPDFLDIALQRHEDDEIEEERLTEG